MEIRDERIRPLTLYIKQLFKHISKASHFVELIMALLVRCFVILPFSFIGAIILILVVTGTVTNIAPLQTLATQVFEGADQSIRAAHPGYVMLTQCHSPSKKLETLKTPDQVLRACASIITVEVPDKEMGRRTAAWLERLYFGMAGFFFFIHVIVGAASYLSWRLRDQSVGYRQI